MFLIIAALAFGIAFGTWLLTRSYQHEVLGMFLIVFSGMGVLGLLIAWPVTYYEAKANIQEFESVRQTIDNARTRDDDWENAALQQMVIEANAWLAGAQYWSSTIFEPMWPDEIDELEPIE